MVKQVIVVRKDLNMPAGKMAGQVAHASLACILNKKDKIRKIPGIHLHLCDFIFTDAELEWCVKTKDSKFTKIVLKVNSEEELLAIYEQARKAGVNCSLIKDAGDTVFDEPTITCVGLGPDEDSVLNAITGDLKLY